MGIAVSTGAAAGGLLASAGHSGALGLPALISWVFTASLGGYMLTTLIISGGLRQQRANRAGLPPAVLFAHFSLALTGLAVWIGYLLTGVTWLAWTAVGLLMPVIGLGVSTVTLWTPYPRHADASAADMADAGAAPAAYPTAPTLEGALTDTVRTGKLIDHLIDELLADPEPAARRPLARLASLVPVGHGIGALTTFLLAVLAAAGMS